MSQIDIAGSLAARDLNVGRVVTVAVNSLEFKEAVKVGDILSCYGKSSKSAHPPSPPKSKSTPSAHTQVRDAVYMSPVRSSPT